MKACPVCGLDLEETYLFCPEDGSPLQRPDMLSQEFPEGETPHAAIEESSINAPGHVVLYCPACAAEYPLTFSDCPVHGVPLTKHSIATFVNATPEAAQHAPEPRMPEPSVERRAPINQEAQNDVSSGGVVARHQLESMPVEAETVQQPLIVEDRAEYQASGYDRSQAIAGETDPEPRSFRIAAIMIIVGLAVLSLAGLYALYSNVSRKSASLAARSAAKSPASAPESEFIPTPQAALDYKEEPVAPPEPEASGPDDETLHDKEPAQAVAAAPVRIAPRPVEERNPPAASSQPPPAATQTPVAVRRPASATDLVLPRGTYGLVDARLIRMRARQTSSGYRYDLTFNLQEQAGRVAQYDRLAVVTHSASGVNHSEVMPFSHRLGAAGDLTFTISVELKGRSEPDWQGRIICTTSGTDNQGRPLRTSFGANVSP